MSAHGVEVATVPPALPRSWHRRRFAKERGLALAGPRWEIYGHPGPDPGELEIEIQYLLV